MGSAYDEDIDGGSPGMTIMEWLGDELGRVFCAALAVAIALLMLGILLIPLIWVWTMVFRVANGG